MPKASRAILLLLLLGVGLAVPCEGADRFSLNGVAVPLQGFRSNGVFRMNADGKGGAGEEVAWAIEGRRAILQVPLCHLTDFRMTLQSPSKGDFLFESPSCTLDQQTQTLHSDAPVVMAGGGMKLEGVGYDVYLDEAAGNIRVVMRQAVRMTVRMEEFPRRKAAREK